MAPKLPGVTLMTPAGFPFQTFCPRGRDPTSIAFFMAAGIPRLCSGVQKRSASVSRTR